MHGLALRGVAFGKNQVFWLLMEGIFVLAFPLFLILWLLLYGAFHGDRTRVAEWYHDWTTHFPRWVKWLSYSVSLYSLVCATALSLLAVIGVGVFGLNIPWLPRAFFELFVSFCWIGAYAHFVLVFSGLIKQVDAWPE